MPRYILVAFCLIASFLGAVTIATALNASGSESRPTLANLRGQMCRLGLSAKLSEGPGGMTFPTFVEGELVEITDDWFLIKTKLVAEDKEESVIWIRKDIVALVTSSSTKLAKEPLQFPGGVAPTFIAPPAGETNE